MRLDFCGLWWKGWMDGWMETEGYNTFWELSAYTLLGICLERPILGEIWDGGDSWAGLDYF